MLVNVIVPDFGLGSRSMQLGQWLVDVGSPVLAGHGLVEIVAEGVMIELPSPVEGVLHSILVSEDDALEIGMRLATVETQSPA
jgi:pyruvate/2-oxoglutarate dehydrogenase complex dihydrolipoamide acyltransferase (E2) component